MGFRIGFKFNFGILQNSMAFRFKRKIKEKGRKNEEKETKETEIRIKLEHINGIQNYICFHCFVQQTETMFSHLKQK